MKQKYKIAVILPVGYRGGSLRGAKLLATAIETGSRQAGEPADVVLGYIQESTFDEDDLFFDLPSSITPRPFIWKIMDLKEACRALEYAGIQCDVLRDKYQVPDDGMNNFLDCDIWIFVSDRLCHAVLPVRPYLVVVYDYLQRYENLIHQDLNLRFLEASHCAVKVIVTTDFTRRDALQYAGVREDRLVKAPMLIPTVSFPELDNTLTSPSFFLWSTNLGPHKNHYHALRALQIYYEQLGGQFECHITGTNTDNMFQSELPHLEKMQKLYKSNMLIQQRVKVLGELPEHSYLSELCRAKFLWHAARVDNGTFSVIEAAHLGVPSLSSNYPAMREMDAQFNLNLSWMDPHNSHEMAEKLKQMELNHVLMQSRLPHAEELSVHSMEHVAIQYWKIVRGCL